MYRLDRQRVFSKQTLVPNRPSSLYSNTLFAKQTLNMCSFTINGPNRPLKIQIDPHKSKYLFNGGLFGTLIKQLLNHNEGLFGTHQYFVETEGLFGISNAMTIYLEGSIWIFQGLFGFANLLGVYLAQGSIWKKLIDGPNGTLYEVKFIEMRFLFEKIQLKNYQVRFVVKSKRESLALSLLHVQSKIAHV